MPSLRSVNRAPDQKLGSLLAILAMAFAMQSALLLAILVLSMVADLVSADSSPSCTSNFAVSGRKFKLQNRPLQAGEGVVCPEGLPSSTVTFCNGAGKQVKIVGNFAAADLGVCEASDNPYTLSATDVITYEQYGDTVVIRIVGRVPAAFRVMVVQGKKIGLGLSGQRYGVSTFIDAGPAYC